MFIFFSVDETSKAGQSIVRNWSGLYIFGPK